MNSKCAGLCLILFAIAFTGLKAQTFSRVYGNITQAELELSRYEKDRSAEAVVLYDIGKSYFIESESSFDVVYERTTRVKILSEAGLKWAEIEIPIYHEGNVYEVINELEASTYNVKDGQLVKTSLSKSNSQDEKVNNYWTIRKIAMPDVKPGSVIEYKYKITSQYKFNLRDWDFQWRIPVVYSEYMVKMIPFYEYSWLLQGATKFSSQTSAEDTGVKRHFGAVEFMDMVHKYTMKDVPAFREEEYITSVNDYIIKIDFQLSKVYSLNGTSVNILTTWPDLVKEMLKDEDFGKYVEKCVKIAPKLADPDTMQNRTPRQKFENILTFVKTNFSWNGSNSKYASGTPNDLIKNKTGNSADINLLAVGMLNSAGIEAYPVLISTRENGKIKSDYPYNRFFNYVVFYANIDGKVILSDATEVFLENDRIPSRCINDKGLVIRKGEVEWISLQSTSPSSMQTSLSIGNIREKAEVAVTVTANEYDAARLRSSLGTDKKKISDLLNSQDYIIDDASIKIKNERNTVQPYTIAFNLAFSPERINDKLYISPFLDQPISENPLKQSKRTLPVDMIYPAKRVYTSTLDIPEGYKVDFIPENLTITNNHYELNYAIVRDEKKVVVTFDYYFKLPVYPPFEYDDIRQFFNEIIKKGSEKIVLSKAL